ncbi:hypothetical protein CON67_00105 [Bacillus toyonensis]|nr:hypothetical protein CON67_00105 [Bacillus toyonensis]
MILNTPLFVKFSANKLTYLTKKFSPNNILESSIYRLPLYYIIFKSFPFVIFWLLSCDLYIINWTLKFF